MALNPFTVFEDSSVVQDCPHESLERLRIGFPDHGFPSNNRHADQRHTPTIDQGARPASVRSIKTATHPLSHLKRRDLEVVQSVRSFPSMQ